ncbi:PAS domain-containing sensor histidine kinase [Sinomicrobium weinanense]|uniref:histidine kinase n=1 Tax=Sinomicrobium weinanense TaxID=2842200 RepID=A0A926JR02_9FLAO|nr:PAS domain-containing sensor histidine kinase [Sinomicrobium weinanense]MBC9795769.1 PAS domain-containing sensor histidine kinase [Sinomicrobium weinanense]MBU3121813.1 PAS domain-containing sensor histidine kinase [Sinomicrobium weinanense]
MKFFQQEEDIFSILLETISEGILVVDGKKNIVAINSPLEGMFGYKEDELLGKSIDILIPDHYKHSHNEHFRNYYARSSKRKMAAGRNLWGIRKDGTQLPVEIGLNPFTIYGKKFIIALVMDVSLSREAENKIRHLNEELEEKVKLRTGELRESVKQLEKEIKRRKDAENKIKNALQREKELNDLKTKFLSLVSHEFKTPLSNVLVSATLIGKYTEAEQQEKREKHLETIKNKVRYLNNILNDFLSVERIDSGKVQYKYAPFNISRVFNEVIYDANMLLKTGQKINFPKDVDDYILFQDEKILELILSNLVRNSIKYSPEHAVIDIEVRPGREMFVFSVRDQGIGIPEEDQKYIFTRYFRAKNALIDQGTGIGLNIVKSHLENLDGEISFVSEEGKGTTFTVKLPNHENDFAH